MADVLTEHVRVVATVVGQPVKVASIQVHSTNAGAAVTVVTGLLRYGYNARRASTDQLISAAVTD